MKNLKELFSNATCLAVLAVFFLFLGEVSQGQGYDTYGEVTTSINGGTNQVDNFSTNTYSILLSATKQSNIPVMIQARPSGTNLVELNLHFQRSLDNVNWDTIDPYLVTISATTNAGDAGYATLVTNLNVGGIPYLRLTKIGNTTSIGLATNVTFTYGIKR